jgi:hypothetical protein
MCYTGIVINITIIKKDIAILFFTDAKSEMNHRVVIIIGLHRVDLLRKVIARIQSLIIQNGPIVPSRSANLLTKQNARMQTDIFLTAP